MPHGGDYKPIACIAHEHLEFAVLRRQRLALEIDDDAGVKRLTVLPLDVCTRAGAEWLVFRDDTGAEARLRLDRIRTFVLADSASS